MKFKLLMFTVFSIGSFVSSANEFKSSPPNGLLELNGGKVYSGALVKRGRHGHEEYCYENKSFVIYSSNLMGEGYEFHRNKPIELECKKINDNKHTKNLLGLSITSLPSTIEEKLNVNLVEGINSIVWVFSREINGVLFDDQTSLEVHMLNGKIHSFVVFNVVSR